MKTQPYPLTLQQLNQQFANHEFIPYEAYLNTENWWAKRNEVIARDRYKCTVCGQYHVVREEASAQTGFGVSRGKRLVRIVPKSLKNRLPLLPLCSRIGKISHRPGK